MSITRINEFQAKDGEQDHLQNFLTSIIQTIQSSKGCQSCKLVQSLEDPARFVIIEIWNDVEAHQASVKNIPPASFAKVMEMLAEMPKGAYYRG